MDRQETLDLYWEVLSGAQTGAASVGEMLERALDLGFRQKLLHTQWEFQAIAQEADEGLRQLSSGASDADRRLQLHPASTLQTVFSAASGAVWADLHREDTPTSRLQDTLHKYPNAHPRAVLLAKRLAQLEESQRFLYKKYLN